MDMNDTLLVDYKSDKVRFELSYGYLDKIYEAFNHRTQQKESIETFIGSDLMVGPAKSTGKSYNLGYLLDIFFFFLIFLLFFVFT